MCCRPWAACRPACVRRGGVCGPAADCEVVPADNDFAAVDAAGADDEVGCHEARQLAVGAVAGRSGERSDLVERAVIKQLSQPFPDGQPSGVVLPPDLLRTAHLLGEVLPPAQLIQFRLPCHADTS